MREYYSNIKINEAGHGGHTVIPALRKLRQEEQEFECSLGYIVKKENRKEMKY
jgi:hypothetical protein